MHMHQLSILPLDGIYGISTVMASLAYGATCVLFPRFDPTLVLQAIERYKARMFALTPPGFTSLLQARASAANSTRDLSSLKAVVSAGSNISRQLAFQLYSALPDLLFVTQGRQFNLHHR